MLERQIKSDCRNFARLCQLACILLLMFAVTPAFGGTEECDDSLTLVKTPAELCIKTENCHAGTCGTSSNQCNATISSEPTDADCQLIYGVNCADLETLEIGGVNLSFPGCSFITDDVCGNGVMVAPETCDDGNTVSGDGCSNTCQIEIEPECTIDADCDNDLFCDGAEVCNVGVCEAGTPPVCDDGAFCNGAESCNVVTDSCESAGDPCSGDACNTCQEDTDSCFDPVGNSCGDPTSDACTLPDTCDGSGVCQPNHEPATAVCRAVDGSCDIEETCDGAGACPVDAFVSIGTICRVGTGDLCDPEEVCTGDAAVCPEDSFEPATTVCNEGSGDSCDPDELCTGVTGEACPADTVTPAETQCREGSGDSCDPDELCTGVTGEACPADTVTPAETQCREGSGDSCDPDEVCTGVTGEACPADTVTPAETQCREGSGDSCDPDEVCTGVTGEACPADTVTPADTQCREGSGDSCDPDEVCTGVTGEACPADTVTPAETQCREGSGDSCDPDEVCTGVAGAACPDDFVEPVTTVCNPSSTGDETCDPSEYCTGNAEVRCPDDFIAPEGFACGDQSTTECSLPDTCDGAGTCEFNNQACGSVTNSSLCEFDVEPDKGTCADGTYAGTACSLAALDADCDPIQGVCVGGDAEGADCFTANGDDDCLSTTGGTNGVCSASAGICEQSDQFRLLFTPDVKNWVAYKLNASNPGQTYYNMIYDASGGGNVTLTVTIPWPYVTVGGNPLHVYDADTVGSDGFGCLDPELAVGIEYTAGEPFSIMLEDWADGVLLDPADDYKLMCDEVDELGEDGTCTFEVTVLADDIPDSGMLYVNLHLDYGLKGQWVDANPVDGEADRYDKAAYTSIWGSSDALFNTDTDDGPLALADCHAYLFEHTDAATAPDPLFEDEVENLNIFKQIAGAFGRVYCADVGGSGFEGYYLELVKPETRKDPEQVVKTAATDEDGYYALPYKHKGKPATYTVNVYDADGGTWLTSTTVELQGNGWAEVNFWAASCDIEPVVWDSSVTYGSGRNKNN